jgi:hypothetical protein
MLPAFLLRAGVDWVRHHPEFANSNPYARCEQAIKVCERLLNDSYSSLEPALIEVATATCYWEEFFLADDPLNDEKEWRDGLTKRSVQYESFDAWQEWFKKSYAKVYSDNNIWASLVMTAWATTHQYQLFYTEDSWDFKPSRSYLPTSNFWSLCSHLQTATEVLKEFWASESKKFEEAGFTISQERTGFLGRVESLGFDTQRYMVYWPARTKLAPEELNLGDLVADIVAPVGDSWYRRPDSVIFAHDHLDVTSLLNRAGYVVGSKLRLYQLACEIGMDKARTQAQAEGWHVDEKDAEEPVLSEVG